MRYLGLLAMVMASTSATAQEGPTERSFAWRMNDKVAPHDPSRTSKNGLGLQIMITGDYEGFLKAWEGSTPPMLSVTDRTERGKPVNAMLIFSGCKAAADGNCNLTAIFNITGPDGAPYGTPQMGTVWKSRPAPGYALQLSEGGIGMIVEPSESLGKYTLAATVTDHVANLTATVKAPVEVVEASKLPVK